MPYQCNDVFEIFMEYIEKISALICSDCTFNHCNHTPISN